MLDLIRDNSCHSYSNVAHSSLSQCVCSTVYTICSMRETLLIRLCFLHVMQEVQGEEEIPSFEYEVDFTQVLKE